MLLSAHYLEQNQLCHEQNAGWGKGGVKFLDQALELHDLYPGGTFLDYGCGKGELAKTLRIPNCIDCRAYDPAIPRFSRTQPDEAFDVVLCTDVVEHIEPDCLDDVLADIRAKLKPDGVAFIVAGLTPAVKVLPDGRNAHLIVEDVDWWEAKLAEHFDPVCVMDARRTTAEFLAWRPE